MEKQNHFNPLPKLLNGKIDKVVLKDLYMKSPEMSWSSFCRENGFDPTMNKTFNFKQWKKEKIDRFTETSKEVIEDAINIHALKWNKDILRTIDTYPQLVDKIKDLIEIKLNSTLEVLKEDPMSVPTQELLMLAKASKDVTEAKYKSLLIDRWNVDVVSKLIEVQNGSTNGNTDTGPVGFKIMGMENYTASEITKALAVYYDAPYKTETCDS